MTDIVQVPREATEGACGYAERLAVIIHKKHYSDVPQWRPLTGDLIGLLTQIDNMTAGMTRAAPQATDPQAEIERLTKLNAGLCRDFNSLLVRESHARTDIAAAQAENEKLRDLLALYRDAVRIDPIMEGPRFAGCNSSALKRAWEADRAAISPPLSPEKSALMRENANLRERLEHIKIVCQSIAVSREAIIELVDRALAPLSPETP